MVWIIALGIGIAAALALVVMFRVSERKTREIELRLKAKRAETALAKLNAEKEWLDKIREHNRLVARDMARARNQEVADRIAANRKPQAPKPQAHQSAPAYVPPAKKSNEPSSSYSSSSSSSDDSFSVGLGIATGLSLFDSPSIDTSSPSPDDFSGGGGDFGGGGASGDW